MFEMVEFISGGFEIVFVLPLGIIPFGSRWVLVTNFDSWRLSEFFNKIIMFETVEFCGGIFEFAS